MTPEAFSLVTTGLGSVIALLLGLLVWFVRREIKQNDEAHKNLGQRIGRVEGKIDRLRTVTETTLPRSRARAPESRAWGVTPVGKVVSITVLSEVIGVLKGILIRHYGSPDHGR